MGGAFFHFQVAARPILVTQTTQYYKMNISTFASEFLADLEARVQQPFGESPLETWDPRKPAAPERHAALGKAAGIQTEHQHYMLEQQNHLFEIIESMLRIFLTVKMYSTATSIDPVKEQVWLFGSKWLTTYYGLLTEPTILRSEFYKKENERFLDLLRQMLQPLPAQRARFIDILRTWDPTNRLLIPATVVVSDVGAAPNVSGASVVPSATANPSMIAPSTVVQNSLDLHPLLQQQLETPVPVPAPPVRQRLVLAPRTCHGGRNKTRKNQHN